MKTAIKSKSLSKLIGGSVLCMFLLLYIVTHLYLIHILAPLPIPRRLLESFIVLLALWYPVSQSILKPRTRHPTFRFLLNRIGHLWIGFLFLFLVSLAVTYLGNFLASLLGIGSLSDREFENVVLLITIVACVGGMFQAYRTPKLVHFHVDRTSRYQQGKSLKIVHLSDLHLGYDLGHDFLRKVVDRVNSLEPDLIVMTGDIMEGDPEYFATFKSELSRFQAKLGVFGVTGNHDFYNGVREFIQIMGSAGIRILQNERLVLMPGIQIMGIHDPTANHLKYQDFESNLEKPLLDLNSQMPSLLMMHQPKAFEPAVDKKVDLILCGHTHKGQIFPLNLIVKRVFDHVSGVYRVSSDTELIVSNGTGFWGPPLRIGAESQIVVVEFLY